MMGADNGSMDSKSTSPEISLNWYVTPKPLKDGSYHPTVHDLFRNRTNVWVQKASKKTALDLWTAADMGQETTENEEAIQPEEAPHPEEAPQLEEAIQGSGMIEDEEVGVNRF